jgi:hypothetical protein
MPQLDFYIIINQIVYVSIFFFFLYFLVDKFVLPYLLIRLKTRQKFLETIFYQASELNTLSITFSKYISSFFFAFFSELKSLELINYPTVPRLNTAMMLYLFPLKASLISTFYDLFLSYYLTYNIVSEDFYVFVLYNLLKGIIYPESVLEIQSTISHLSVSDELTTLVYLDLENNLQEIE